MLTDHRADPRARRRTPTLAFLAAIVLLAWPLGCGEEDPECEPACEHVAELCNHDDAQRASCEELCRAEATKPETDCILSRNECSQAQDCLLN